MVVLPIIPAPEDRQDDTTFIWSVPGQLLLYGQDYQKNKTKQEHQPPHNLEGCFMDRHHGMWGRMINKTFKGLNAHILFFLFHSLAHQYEKKYSSYQTCDNISWRRNVLSTIYFQRPTPETFPASISFPLLYKVWQKNFLRKPLSVLVYTCVCVGGKSWLYSRPWSHTCSRGKMISQTLSLCRSSSMNSSTCISSNSGRQKA